MADEVNTYNNHALPLSLLVMILLTMLSDIVAAGVHGAMKHCRHRSRHALHSAIWSMTCLE